MSGWCGPERMYLVKTICFRQDKPRSRAWQGINALEQGFGLFADLREELMREEHPVLGRSTLQVTMAEGGIAPNMTPDRAQFLADIRIVPPLNERRF